MPRVGKAPYSTAVDLTEHVDDPVDVLFATQLGGGNDSNGAERPLTTPPCRSADRVGLGELCCAAGCFPDLMAAAIERRDLNRWATAAGLIIAENV